MAKKPYVHQKTNQVVPSVTTVLSILDKPALVWWSANETSMYIRNAFDSLADKQNMIHKPLHELYPIFEKAPKEFRKVSAEALNIGSEVHSAVEFYNKNKAEPKCINDKVLSGFLAYLEWEAKNAVQPIQLEHTVYDADGTYAGTCDMVCLLNGKKYLVDFKTTKQPSGNKPYDEWKMQLAAYADCVDGIEGIGILRLDKESGFPDFYDLTEYMESGLAAFKALLTAYTLLKTLK